MTMKFTVAIPTYNNENTIEKAIDSALQQDFSDDYEILVVNNNSTDKTSEIVKNIEDTRLKIISNLETCTLFENHNVCLREAGGDYIIFCHSDDELDPQALSILSRKIYGRGMPQKYIAWGYSLFRDFSSALVNAKLQTGKIFAGIVAVGPFINGGLTPSGTCYSKSFIEIGGFLPTKYRLTPSDSSSMIYAALNGFRFEMLDELLLHRRNASTARNDDKKSDIEVAYLDGWSALCKKINKSSQLDILGVSQSLRYVNPVFYNYMSQKYPREVLSRMVKKLIITPSCARHPLFRKTFFKCLRASWG